MTKPVCCLLIALGLAACAKKDVVVDQPPPTEGTAKPVNKPRPDPGETPAVPPNKLVNSQSGMMVPPLENTLPTRNDMTATAPVGPGGGGVIATPPTADKRGE
ncbi:hypothetical protein [Luteolibacter soli]|uniref:Lipoprotein n=1 Tax=Luteolibacter soli TaxID=3135280 RepID=A0ABU9B1F7_9BACT